MTVYVIYRCEKVVEVVRKIARVKFVHDFTWVLSFAGVVRKRGKTSTCAGV